MRSSLVMALLVLGVAACSEPGTEGLPNPFATAVTRLVVEVDVQEGAEPFTGPAPYGDTWDLTEENLGALVGDDKELSVPSTLGEMGAVTDVPAGDLDIEQLLEVSAANRDVSADGDGSTAAYHVLFLDRFFEANGERQRNVLGVSISERRVIAMFKPVIGEGGIVFPEGVDRFVEQATIVHELGHSLGLVNNGLPMVRDHEDPEHPAHCANDRCVMYYLNEGATDAAEFARDAIGGGDIVLFDDDCLDDAAAAVTDEATSALTNDLTND